MFVCFVRGMLRKGPCGTIRRDNERSLDLLVRLSEVLRVREGAPKIYLIFNGLPIGAPRAEPWCTCVLGGGVVSFSKEKGEQARKQNQTSWKGVVVPGKGGKP